jgi:hypothetical protein
MHIIFENEKFCYNLVLPNDYNRVEWFTAQEISKYFEQMTGHEIEITYENCIAQKGKHIYIGKTRRLVKEGLLLGSDAKIDSFLMKSVGDDIFLAGNAVPYYDNTTLYAAYEFLERFFGVRFYSFDEEFVPTYCTLEVPDFDTIEAPDFEWRDPCCNLFRIYPEFGAKSRVRDICAPDLLHLQNALFPLWAPARGHNSYELLPPVVYAKDHPQWYDKENVQLCYTNEEIINKIVDLLKCKIAANSHSLLFVLTQEDTLNAFASTCQCENCKKSNEQYTPTGTLIRFVNAVSKEIDCFVKENYPNRAIKIVTLAYYFSFEPPVKKEEGAFLPIDKSVVPNDNVMIYIAPVQFCYYHSLSDEECEYNKTFLDSLKGWKALTDNLMVFGYSANYAHSMYPFYNFDSTESNYRMYKEYGIKYFLDLASNESPYVEFQELRAYVASKMMWNTKRNVKDLMEEFIDGYYKNAAFAIKKYLNFIQEHYRNMDSDKSWHLRVYHLPEKMFFYESFPLEFIQTLLSCQQEATKAVNEISDKKERKRLQERVDRVFLSVKYLLLMNYEHYYKEGKEEFANSFINECLALGITKYKENWEPRTDLISLMDKAMKNEVLKY